MTAALGEVIYCQKRLKAQIFYAFTILLAMCVKYRMV
jgi:hypothetical protein